MVEKVLEFIEKDKLNSKSRLRELVHKRVYLYAFLRSNGYKLQEIGKECTVDEFKSLVDQARLAGSEEFGDSHDPYQVIQITHSGRISKPHGTPINKVACYNPHLDKRREDITL